jgi:hypothetical protein
MNSYKSIREMVTDKAALILFSIVVVSERQRVSIKKGLRITLEIDRFISAKFIGNPSRKHLINSFNCTTRPSLVCEYLRK